MGIFYNRVLFLSCFFGIFLQKFPIVGFIDSNSIRHLPDSFHMDHASPTVRYIFCDTRASHFAHRLQLSWSL